MALDGNTEKTCIGRYTTIMHHRLYMRSYRYRRHSLLGRISNWPIEKISRTEKLNPRCRYNFAGTYTHRFKAIWTHFYRIHGKKGIHIVSAWADRLGIVLSQRKPMKKTNEITVIPELLELMDLNWKKITMNLIKLAHEPVGKKQTKKKASMK